MPKKLTKKEVQEKIDLSFGKNEYTLMSDYNGTSKPIIVRHNLCGYEYEIKKSNNFINEKRSQCPKCKKIISHSTKHKTEDEIKKIIKEETNGEYSYLSGYINSNTKMKIKHNICGNIFDVSPHMFLGVHKTRCPKCSNNKRGKYLISKNYLEKILLDLNLFKEYEWLEEYKGNNKIKYKIKHIKCGKEYNVRPNDFQQGNRCPFCSLKSSKTEKEIEIQYLFILKINNFFNYILLKR